MKHHIKGTKGKHRKKVSLHRYMNTNVKVKIPAVHSPFLLSPIFLLVRFRTNVAKASSLVKKRERTR